MPKKGSRKVSNPLALAVLAVLAHGPMHPYEMGRTLRERRNERSIGLNYGSLYMVVDQLSRADFISAQGTQRDGQRPERTVYALTDAGRDELREWMRDLVSTRHKEFHEFAAALALIVVLPPREVADLLRARLTHLDEEIAGTCAEMEGARARGVQRLFLIEDEYRLALARAERDFVESSIDFIAREIPEITGVWRRFHHEEKT